MFIENLLEYWISAGKIPSAMMCVCWRLLQFPARRAIGILAHRNVTKKIYIYLSRRFNRSRPRTYWPVQKNKKYRENIWETFFISFWTFSRNLYSLYWPLKCIQCKIEFLKLAWMPENSCNIHRFVQISMRINSKKNRTELGRGHVFISVVIK